MHHKIQQNLATVRLDTVRNSIKRGNLTCLCLILLFLCIKNLNTMRFDTTRTSIQCGNFAFPGQIGFTLFYLATTRQPINPPDTLKKRKTGAQKPQKSNNLYRKRVQSGYAYNLMISRLYPDAIRVICWFSREHARSTHINQVVWK